MRLGCLGELGPVLVMWARGQCGGSVMMRAVFGAQLPTSQLPAAACVDTISHVDSRPFNGGSLGCLTCVIYCRMFFEERSENNIQKSRYHKICVIIHKSVRCGQITVKQGIVERIINPLKKNKHIQPKSRTDLLGFWYQV